MFAVDTHQPYRQDGAGSAVIIGHLLYAGAENVDGARCRGV